MAKRDETVGDGTAPTSAPDDPGAAPVTAKEVVGHGPDGRQEVDGAGADRGGGMDRRQFLRRAGLGAGVLAAGGGLPGALASCEGTPFAGPRRDVVVVGAGAFGGWTAHHLQRLGARVTLVDAYGFGNSRATSGDETRGIRSAYGDRELWTAWANRAIRRWHEIDDEWGREFGRRVFFTTGDLILRSSWDDHLERTSHTFDQVGVDYEVLDVDEVRYRWPQFATEGIEVALHEKGAGVGKSRLTCELLAESLRRRGGELRVGRATPGRSSGVRLETVDVQPGDPLSADLFVFALGPWFPKAFPELMGDRIRIPMGHVYYFGTPPGDDRFAHPNMPSFGIPGGTGWPTLPPNHRGFRLRTGGRAQPDPDTSVRWIPEEYVEIARETLAQRFPALAGVPLIETRACHYESSPDREWIIDRHPDYQNVWFAGAGNAEGFKFGPVLGEYIARRLLDDDPHPELAEQFRLLKEEDPVAGRGRVDGLLEEEDPTAGPRRMDSSPDRLAGRNPDGAVQAGVREGNGDPASAPARDRGAPAEPAGRGRR